MNPSSVKKKVITQLAKIKSKKGIYTFVSKPEDYLTINKAIISYLTKNLKLTGVYVTLNKSCRALSEMFSQEKIETKKILFIECAGQEPKSKVDNCISLKSNLSLTELSLSISESCKNNGTKFVFLDSVSTILIYNNLETTERFIHYMVNRVKNMDILMVLISIEEEKSNKLLPILSQFCDKVIKI